MTKALPMAWRCAHVSIQGRKRLGNQDASLARQRPQGAGWVVAVADGHGAAPYFRSHIGARLAVEAADAVLPAAGTALIQDWRLKVRQHRRALDEPDHADGVTYLAYGTTLIAAYGSGADLELVQIGDGDALWLPLEGPPLALIAQDPRLGGGPTTSLCPLDAERHVRQAQLQLPQQPGVLLLATDGWRNAFSSEAGFVHANAILRDLAWNHGPQAVCGQFARWFERHPLADDCSLALAVWGGTPASTDDSAIERNLAAISRAMSSQRRRLKLGLVLVFAALAALGGFLLK